MYTRGTRSLLLPLAWFGLPHITVEAFQPTYLTSSASCPSRHWTVKDQPKRQQQQQQPQLEQWTQRFPSSLASSVDNVNQDDDDETSSSFNPYADPNYPDLEFVNYDDPDYVVDQGDEFYNINSMTPSSSTGISSTTVDSTEEEIEAMREDRRRRNDEYQFETYFRSILKEGDLYYGEWSLYKTSTFMEQQEEKIVDKNNADDSSTTAKTITALPPRVVRARYPIKVQSRGYKISIDTESAFRVDGEAICHEEILIPDDDNDQRVNSPQQLAMETEIMKNTYWPDQLRAIDFRGSKGIMCVGNAHTIAKGIPLIMNECNNNDNEDDGPFAQLRTEVGLSDQDLRMRIKLDYSVLEKDERDFLSNYNDDATTTTPPPLHLKSLTVCREARGRWPCNGILPDDRMVSQEELEESESLFGLPGADGGLYDPPPVGGDEQASQYMMLDLEGGATILFPFQIQQDPTAFAGYGWVTSLDWTPGPMRYQVDRKVKGGKEVLGLRTLELSEVQSANAQTYRPRDGGLDMRQ